MSLNCLTCKSHCCGGSPVKAPILLTDDELQRFVEYCVADNGVIRLRRENGVCCFLDESTRKCRIYNNRPIECRLYPYIIQYNIKEKKISLKLHDGCSDNMNIDVPIIPKELLDVPRERLEFFENAPM